MQYLMLDTADRAELIARLEAMPEFLEAAFRGLPPEALTQPGADGSFSPVEHCWHLADVEREAYFVRIRRLHDEVDPQLPGFDGARVARERNYRSLSFADGVAAFRGARHANVAILRALGSDAWTRGGIQEGVGAITLCDLPAMMAEHDAAHQREIEGWMRAWNAQ